MEIKPTPEVLASLNNSFYYCNLQKKKKKKKKIPRI